MGRQRDMMPTSALVQRKTASAPTSYIGSARRLFGWFRQMGRRNVLLGLAAFVLVVVAIPFVWIAVTLWYVFTIIGSGGFLFPYRLLRRSSRKQEHLQATHLATTQAMLILQQQEIARQRESQRGG